MLEVPAVAADACGMGFPAGGTGFDAEVLVVGAAVVGVVALLETGVDSPEVEGVEKVGAGVGLVEVSMGLAGLFVEDVTTGVEGVVIVGMLGAGVFVDGVDAGGMIVSASAEKGETVTVTIASTEKKRDMLRPRFEYCSVYICGRRYSRERL